MDKLRVLLSFLSDASLSDGCVGHTGALVGALEAAHCDVEVIALSGTGESRVGGNLVRSFPPTLGGMLQVTFATVGRMLRVRPDLLVCTSLGAPFNPFAAFSARVLGVPVLFDCQDPPVESMDLVFGNNAKGKLLRNAVAFMDPLLRSSTRWTFAVSPGVSEILRKRGWRMPILKFYNVHGLGAIRPDGPVLGYRAEYGWQSSIVLIYAGGLQPGIRGIETQLQAVARARAAGADVKFVAFGRGDLEAFQRMSRDLGIAEHVRFPGEIPRSQLHAALREADVAVMSTLPFALPSKVFEYLACGLAVVCSADNRDILDAFGPYVAPFDGSIGSLAQVLRTADFRKNRGDVASMLTRFQEENNASVRAVCALLREMVTSRKVKAAGSISPPRT